LCLAGREVRVRTIGGTDVDALLVPLEHLRIPEPSRDPDLTIDVWDDRVAVMGLPSDIAAAPWPPWQASVDGRVISYRYADSAAAMDRAARRIVVAFVRAPSLRSRGRPFNDPLRLWLADRRIQLLHAGLVARAGKGVIFGGANGSGKSTAALACLRAGYDYLGDDCVGFATNAGPHHVGYSIFGSVYLEPDHLRSAFPEVTTAIAGQAPHEDKALVFPSLHFADRMTRSASIRALVLPRRSGRAHARVTPAPKGEALLRLAPSSVLGAPRTHRDGLDDIASLVGAVPCYWLDLGDDPAEIPPRVDEVLSSTPNR